MRLAPAGLDPIDGVVDYATGAFLGVRSADALFRFYGRDAGAGRSASPHHLFAPAPTPAASERAWRDWLDGVFATEAVA